eukprot:CAMPEP_0194064760 /NCGR_PEP_ID=MMETSP0009_2-20130614/83830_1 /TAXON_ID=210454 /ORGANISM="Grammatophora oceanica, Strain CCMP 410" /LENGTH=50 /DNA_ID=CAMNT_0038717351 /DNA_START=55 /DNA_END=203 /DNA_ORIENTATION=+
MNETDRMLQYTRFLNLYRKQYMADDKVGNDMLHEEYLSETHQLIATELQA